jgi:tungstate transport system permease protein
MLWPPLLRRHGRPEIESVSRAWTLVSSLDPEVLGIVGLSLGVSLSAAVLGMAIGAPLGGLLAVARFPGRRGIVVLVNGLMGLPPVVVGLLIYLLLSHSGPLGFANLLFTPWAMVLAQAVLTTPIAVALSHSAVEPLWAEYGDLFRLHGARRGHIMREMLSGARPALLTVFLAAFGRAIAEVGAIIIVGGNIRGHTRTMTTAIALQTSTGDLSLALALGLILIVISVSVSGLGFALQAVARRP